MSNADLLEHVLVPVSDEKDAAATARALAPYGPAAVTVLHVVEKGGGAIDRTPVEYSKETAEDAFAAFRDEFPEARTETAYDREVLPGILKTARAIDASAIVYRSRGGGRITQFLSGDVSVKLVTKAERPVVALPTDGDR